MQTLALSSRDGRFQVSVASDDFELIASMLLLLEMVPAPTASGVHLEELPRPRPRQCRNALASRAHASAA